VVTARETTLQELLEGSKQYRVPLYQRTYSWKREQLTQLWDDVVQLAEDRTDNDSATHFIGSVVLAPSPGNGPTGVPQYLVVDGQQRLTTLTLLLCAIRDHRAKSEDAGHRARMNDLYLTNPWKPEPQRLKVVPTQTDREAYLACIDSTPHAGGGDPIGTTYRFFSAKLAELDDPDDQLDIERLENAVIYGLALVSVTTHPGDNAHRIFESLNNTGQPLTQGDLLRNYLFMRLPTRAEPVYQSLWLPLQNQLSAKDLELLFWLDLVQRDARVKQTDTYAGQQARLDRLKDEADIEAEVARLCGLGSLLCTILDPATEAHDGVRLRLERLRAWGTTTVYPLLLHLLDRRQQGTATSEEISSAMLYVESFFVRRLLIGRATANINRILLAVVTEMDRTQPVDQAVHAYLSTGRKFYAADDEIRSAVRTVPYYLNGRPLQRSLILRWLEVSHGSKEPVDLSSLTIEHVMPQTPTDEWEKAVSTELEPGESFELVHESLVHTLGNLTLTGYNSELSNSPFDVKKVQLAKSGLAMNQHIAEQERWGRTQIHERADALAERVISTWPGPLAGTRSSSGVAWNLMNTALAALPSGSWTTYGDVAAIIGSQPVAVGTRLATVPAPNPHRVLQSGGVVSPGFKWLEAGRDDDPRDVLRAEGVEFDEQGRADEKQRITLEELAELIGVELESTSEPLPSDLDQAALLERFTQHLHDKHGDDVTEAVLEVIEAWLLLGGRAEFGTGRNETSCFLFAREKHEEGGNIWPVTIYPSGKVEVVFQHLRIRPPFDDVAMREELRQRLNAAPGVDLAAAKIELRPGFPVRALADPTTRAVVLETLKWFYDQARTTV
jgi:alkylated DNA nucleotide flippase Atl1